MSHIYTLFFLLLSITLPGQITLENTYVGNYNYSHRFTLEVSGVKYYMIDSVNKKLEIYNQNHSLWKAINLPHLPKSKDKSQFIISQHLFNDNDLVEVLYTYRKASGVEGITIINENGGQLFNADAGSSNIDMSFDVNQIAGLEDKLLIHAKDANGLSNEIVHSLPSLSQDHIFFNKTWMTRVNLELLGEQYVTKIIENGTQKLEFHTPDFSFWKTVNLNIPNNFTFGGITNISQKQLINTDDYIKIAYYCFDNNNNVKAFITNENGMFILQNQNGIPVINKIYGLSDKLILTDYINDSHNIYSIPGLFYDHSFGFLQRKKLEISGEVYVSRNVNTNIDSINIYNPNYLQWKSLALYSPFGSTTKVLDVTEKKLASDNAIEVLYHYINTNGEGIKVVSDAGNLVFEEPSANDAYISSLENEPNKLICHIKDGNDYITKVYSLPTITATIFVNDTRLTVFPNPFQKELNISFEQPFGKGSLSIFDISGKSIYYTIFENENSLYLNNLNLEDGMYIMSLQTDKGAFVKKIIHSSH